MGRFVSLRPPVLRKSRFQSKKLQVGIKDELLENSETPKPIRPPDPPKPPRQEPVRTPSTTTAGSVKPPSPEKPKTPPKVTPPKTEKPKETKPAKVETPAKETEADIPYAEFADESEVRTVAHRLLPSDASRGDSHGRVLEIGSRINGETGEEETVYRTRDLTEEGEMKEDAGEWFGSKEEAVYGEEIPYAEEGDEDSFDEDEEVEVIEEEDDSTEGYGEPEYTPYEEGPRGPTNHDYSSIPPPSVSQAKVTYSYAVSDRMAKAVFADLFGDDWETSNKNPIASVVSAPNTSEVRIIHVGRYTPPFGDDVVDEDSVGVRLTITDPIFQDKATYFVGTDSEGNKFLRCEFQKLNTDVVKSGEGYGRQIMKQRVSNCREYGFKYLSSHASGDGGVLSFWNSIPKEQRRGKPPFNGFYTMIRYGYNQSIDNLGKFQPDLANTIKDKFPGVEYLSDLMLTEGGAKWWQENGKDVHDAKFDLTDDSVSMYVWDKYLEKKERQKDGKSLGIEKYVKAMKGGEDDDERERRGVEFEVDLTPEDDEILDEVWRELREWKEKQKKGSKTLRRRVKEVGNITPKTERSENYGHESEDPIDFLTWYSESEDPIDVSMTRAMNERPPVPSKQPKVESPKPPSQAEKPKRETVTPPKTERPKGVRPKEVSAPPVEQSQTVPDDPSSSRDAGVSSGEENETGTMFSPDDIEIRNARGQLVSRYNTYNRTSGRWEEGTIRLMSGYWTDPDSGEEIPVFRWYDPNTDANGEWNLDQDYVEEQGRKYAEDLNDSGEPEDDEQDTVREDVVIPEKNLQPIKSKAITTIDEWINTSDKDRQRTLKFIKKLTGSDDPHVFASLTGAPDDATVHITPDLPAGVIQVRVYHPKIESMSRSFAIDDRGRKYIHNDEFFLKDKYRKDGMGREAFRNEVAWAIKNGFSYIDTYGIGTGRALTEYNDMSDDDKKRVRTPSTGFYVWPRFGYDGKVPSKVTQKFPGVTRFNQLMQTKEGRDWWKANGHSSDFTFDLSEGSTCRKILDEYIEETKNKPKEQKSLSRIVKAMEPENDDDREKGDEIYLSPEDEEILDRIWDRIGKENQGNDTKAMSYLSTTSGGALVPPPKQKGLSRFRSVKSVVLPKVKPLSKSYLGLPLIRRSEK